MEIRGNNGFIESFVAQRLGQQIAAPSNSRAPARNSQTTNSDNEIIAVSRDLVVKSALDSASASQTRLVKEATEETEKGYRRTQTFERADGRNFTRIEEFTVNDRNARRTVIQQNVSGSTTRLDEIFERQSDGTFRLTQRFTDEAGETSTQIQANYISADPFVLSGGAISPGQPTPTAQGNNTLRGTQLDLQA